MTKIWNDNPELVERLKHMWEVEGLSAGQIMKRLGNGISRNAVIGRIHRMKLSSGKPVRIVPPKPVSKPKPLPVPPPIDLKEPAPLFDDAGAPITVINARDVHCRWVHGDSTIGTFRYCGAQTSKGSFCEYHAPKAYQPASPRSDAA